MYKCKNNLPVPEPIAPRASAITERAPIHIPPNQAAVGMYLKNIFFIFDRESLTWLRRSFMASFNFYLLSSWIIDESLNPLMTIPCSFNCLETSLADEPETSIHV